jgi:glycerol-3-phosphate dehydrogenase
LTEHLKKNEYDLLILGGGINGCMLYRTGTNSSKKVILIEKNDYSSGTSQASGMMVWGGILYLKNLEFNLVRKLCKARDNLIKHSNQVYTRHFNFAFLKNGERSLFVTRGGLGLYRLLGLLERSATKSTTNKQLPFQWDKCKFKDGLSYEEGFLKKSDSQFIISWLFRKVKSESKTYNYSNVKQIEWLDSNKHFEIKFSDANKQMNTIFAKTIVNTCGIWADGVNEKFNIKTKASHHLSKGVYLLFKNTNNQKDAFVVDMEEQGDTLCWIPWGKTIMWGPTETTINSIEELPVTKDDVQFLLDKLNSKLEKKLDFQDIINVRTGIRPLVKINDKKVKYSLELSRKAILESDKNLPWHTVFGGKLSGSLEFSNKVYYNIFKKNPYQIQYNSTIESPMTKEFFNGMNLPDVKWSVEHTQVRCLEDYLRRRTNIAQWIPVGGLGFNNEYLDDIKKISKLIHPSDKDADYDFKNYTNIQRIERSKWKN